MLAKTLIKKIINKLPYTRNLYIGNQEYHRFKTNSCFPPGHFYSPIILVDNIKEKESEIWPKEAVDKLHGIELKQDEQLKLLRDFIRFYKEIPFRPEKQTNLRYQFENEYFGYTDGVMLYSMIRNFEPQRIIEIGSGFSSSLMLDTNELFFAGKIHLTFIDPNPERLYSLITEKDRKSVTIETKEVQSVNLEMFKDLQKGDILFVDSSHVIKTGSDVNFILFNILPILHKGVLIHFHDVLYPFEYPKEWVYAGRNWNENYFLRAFLMYNDSFEIRLFSSFLHKYFIDSFNDMPLCQNDPGANLWLVKK